MFFEGATTSLLIATMSLLTEYYQRPSSFISTLVAVKGFAMILTLWFSGKMSDRYGRRIIIPLGAVFFIASLVLMISSNAIWVAFLSVFLAGIGHGLMDAPAISMLVDVFGNDTGPAMSYVQVFFALGMTFISFITSVFVARALPWQWIFIGLIVCAFILIIYVLSVDMPTTRFEEPHDAVSLSNHQPKLMKEGLWIAVTALFYSSFGAVISTWVANYMHLIKGYELAASIQMLSLYQLGCLVGAVLFAWILTKVHPTVIYWVNGVIAIIATLAMIYLNGFEPAAIFMTGVVIGVMFSIALTIGGSLFKSQAGEVTGFIGSINGIGQTFMSFLSGLLYPIIGYTNLFLGSILLCVMAVLLAFAFRRHYVGFQREG